MELETAHKIDAMATAKAASGITFQQGRNVYKVCVGKHESNGRLLSTIHWLGRDQEHALFSAFTIRRRWRYVQSVGRDRWNDEDFEQIKGVVANAGDMFSDATTSITRKRQELDEQESMLKQLAFAMPSAAGAKAIQPKIAPATLPPTLYKAIDAYLASLKDRNVSEGHCERATQILTDNLKRTRTDIPLDQVDYAWLESLANHFKKRPESKRKKGERISAETAALILRYLRGFFIWLDDSSWSGWEGPRKLAKVFRCTAKDLMSSVELRRAATIEQFDLPTLRKLYATADDLLRRCMLLGLFAGATQMELAVLEKSEFDLDSATLHHFRNKTGVEGKFWLPAEAVNLLRKDFAKRKKDKLAFRSYEGLPLVMFADGRKSNDCVANQWANLRRRAELDDALSFKYLRKFLADWMTQNGGEEMGMIALSHARKTVLSKNYTSARQFERFNNLQQQMYAELTAAKVFSGTAADPT